MNIFILSLCIAECARFHCDKHVVKMILETTQLLCTAHHMAPGPDGYVPPYKKTHYNHPCAIWVRASAANYRWLQRLGIALCKEYTHRYGKVHKCEQYLRELALHFPNIPIRARTPFALAMPDAYKNHDDPVASYRAYYLGEKSSFLSWKSRSPPSWYPINN